MCRQAARTATVLMVISAIAMVLAGGAAAKVKPSVGSQRVLAISAQVAPMTPLDGATITVTDADGKVIGAGSTVNAGAAQSALGQGHFSGTCRRSRVARRGRTGSCR